ncbi:hypothetical protein QJU43_06330 [Pasteurella atlantica]|uniref:Uncharacterized protein n=1 Tax=Phocoenobacter skyensis TaxID=97481 RepID=A0ABT9JNK2_9PAST|nr:MULTISPECIES: hypothetical protein [Pasteurella]MDP8033725.1 hypothetical protein [Pasteurella atlantica]MDP8035660.1 hypothetical protein [Pasteurella atlantica]MDP8037659.1 hypothetical protein [Pasteurella atlantica]MDP8047960.1 hypothetical protein [Pasteurella atlantica]MDP8049915.1 hypothetical protein [Pasteurella atlantica]
MKKIFYIIVLQLLYSTLLVATPLQYDNLQKPIIKKLPLYLVDNNEKKYIKIFYNPMLAINQEHTEEMREFAEYLKKHPIPFFQKEPNMQELNNEWSEQCINMAGMYQMKSTNFNEPNEKVVALLKKLRPMKKEERAMYCTRLLIEWIKNQK